MSFVIVLVLANHFECLIELLFSFFYVLNCLEKHDWFDLVQYRNGVTVSLNTKDKIERRTENKRTYI